MRASRPRMPRSAGAVSRRLLSTPSTVALALVLAGAATIALAVPALLAALQAQEPLTLLAPGRETAATGAAIVTLPDGTLQQADRQLARAALWNGRDYQIPFARAAVLGARAAQAAADERRPLLQAARREAEAALAAAPARTDVWTRFLQTAYLSEGLSARTLAALRMAYLTGPREPQPMRTRLLISLKHWPSLSPELRERARRQIDDMWVAGTHPELAFVHVRTTDLGRLIITSRMPEDPMVQRRFAWFVRYSERGGRTR